MEVSGKLIHEHLWDRRTEPLSVRRGAEIARRADRGKAHEWFYPASELSGEITLLLLHVCVCIEFLLGSAECYSAL